MRALNVLDGREEIPVTDGDIDRCISRIKSFLAGENILRKSRIRVFTFERSNHVPGFPSHHHGGYSCIKGGIIKRCFDRALKRQQPAHGAIFSSKVPVDACRKIVGNLSQRMLPYRLCNWYHWQGAVILNAWLCFIAWYFQSRAFKTMHVLLARATRAPASLVKSHSIWPIRAPR